MVGHDASDEGENTELGGWIDSCSYKFTLQFVRRSSSFNFANARQVRGPGGVAGVG